MTSAAGEGEHDRRILQLRACQRCGQFDEALGPLQLCSKCGFDYGADTPQLPVWPWPWWHANIVQTIASVLVALNLAFGAIRLATLTDPTVSLVAALLFALPVIDLKRRRRRQARGETDEWICLCPGGPVTGRGNFVVSAPPWSAFEAFSMEPQAPGRWRLQLVASWRKIEPVGSVDVELLLTDEQAEALQREIASHLRPGACSTEEPARE